ncbi:polycystin-2-like [Branchiostoma floridae x Branchiostoma belcheri]
MGRNQISSKAITCRLYNTLLATAVILAFGTSVLCACRAKSDTDDKDKDEDVEAGKRQPVEETLPAEPLTGWSELEETEKLKQQRAERKNWLQLTNNGRQCILGIIIITAAILMVHEVWNPSAPAINQGLKAGFSNGTNLVKTQKDVLPWLEDAFARKLYPTQQYNGDALDWRDSVFISDMPAYRVGPVRLRQFRAHTGMCDVAKPALHANKTCVMPYVSGIEGEAAASFPESSPETFSHVLHGTMGSYGGPGYRVNIGEMQAEMMETLRILKANRWIDPYTTALVLDLTLYHVNANLFSTVSVLFEFPPSAGAIATLKVSTFPLTAQGMAPTILFVAKAVFVACLLYVIIRLVKNARKEGRSFFLQVWTVVEVASIVTSLYVIGAMASKDAFAGKAKSLISQELQKEQRSFVDLTDVAFWTYQFTAAVAMVIWLNLVKICSLLRVSARVHTLINIRMQLLGSLAIFILTVMGFSMLGYLLFCPYVETSRSLSAATVGLTFLPWGEVSYDVLATPSELVGPLFLFASGFTIMYLLLSFTAGVFVSATSAMMGEKGRGKVAAARQRKNRFAKAAREARAAVPPARNTLHYCNCDESNECFGQTHTAETRV